MPANPRFAIRFSNRQNHPTFTPPLSASASSSVKKLLKLTAEAFELRMWLVRGQGFVFPYPNLNYD
jgi:hypothetical protein